MKRPRNKLGQLVTTPRTALMMNLLGCGPSFHQTAVSRDEEKALRKLYEFTDDSKDGPLERAGTTRNLLRHVQNDGARVMAYLAQFLSPGEDPVAFLATQLSDVGYDVSGEDVDWAQNPDTYGEDDRDDALSAER